MTNGGLDRASTARRWAEDLALLVDGLEAAVPALGVARDAVDLALDRWMGEEVYVGSRDRNGARAALGVFVALAAARRGFPAAEALAMGRAADRWLLEAYRGAYLYIPADPHYVLRDAWVVELYRPEIAQRLMRRTGLTHHQMQRVLRSAWKRRAGRAG